MFDMKKATLASLLLAAASIAAASLALMSGTPVAAQSASAGASSTAATARPIPRMADGHPDMSGVWWPGHDLVPAQATAVYREGERQGIGAQSFGSLYKPEVMAKAKTLSDKDDPALWCIPSIIGPTPLVGNGLVGEIVQTPKTVVQLIETYHGFRIIPTDGRPHRDDVVPSNHGDAVGRWEGDTLIVDVTNFSDRNWLHHHGDVSFHSDVLHMVETYRLTDADTLEINVTADDPQMLTGTWKAPTVKLVRAPFEHIMETSCENTETANLIEAASKDNYGRKK
jgi:hypothetical protein